MGKRRKKKTDASRAPICHSEPIEVVKNLYCGGELELPAMVSAPIRVDILVPLNTLDATIWDMGFRGEILHYPIRDYGILPDDVLDALVSNILERLNQNKKIGLFCLGGHGRTGYVASAVLGKLGYKDPIAYLRANYCARAVESNAQVRHIAEYLGKPELAEAHAISSVWENELWSDQQAYYGLYGCSFPMISGGKICGLCTHFIAGKCLTYKIFVEEYDRACGSFKAKL